MKKIWKQGMLCMAALAAVLCVTAPKVQAAEYAASSYVLSDNSGELGQELAIVGGVTQEIKLEVKKEGQLHATFKRCSRLGENQKISIELLDSNGAQVFKGDVTKTEGVYINKHLKQRDYTLRISSNLKKDVQRLLEFAMAFDDQFDCYANGESVYNVVNKNRNSYYTFYNDKDQVVRITAGADGYEDDPVYNLTMTITDQNGKQIEKKKINVDDSIPDVTQYYLKKGTYAIKCKMNGEDGTYIKISTDNSATSRVKLNATSKKKAANYTGKNFSMSYTSASGNSKTQWIKIDTSKKAYAFHVEAGRTIDSEYRLEKTKVTLYNSKGKKLESANLVHGLVATSDSSEDYHYFSLKKNTGVYYLAVEAKPNHVVNVKKDTVTAEVSYNGKTSYLVKANNGYQVKSSSKKKVTATFKVKQTAYISLSMDGVKGLTLYNSKGKKVSTYNGLCYKLNPGTYTLKGTAKKAKKNYNLSIKMLNTKAMSQVIEAKNKKAEFTLKGLKKGTGYNIYLGYYADFTGGIKSVKIYDPNNKLVLSKKDSYVTFEVEKSGTYRVVVETKKNGACDYELTSW